MDLDASGSSRLKLGRKSSQPVLSLLVDAWTNNSRYQYMVDFRGIRQMRTVATHIIEAIVGVVLAVPSKIKSLARLFRMKSPFTTTGEPRR